MQEFTAIRLDTWLFFIYFIYGLFFFGMGLAAAMEAGREPVLAEGRALRPLAAFGLVHGAHEWFEAYLLALGAEALTLPAWIAWLRVGLLAASFAFLLLFAYNCCAQGADRGLAGWLKKNNLLALYWLALLVWALAGRPAALMASPDMWDALARYTLGAPASLLAALALNARSRQSRAEARPRLAWYFLGTALGFGVYALTQVFVRPVDAFPADVLNLVAFTRYTGIPIQLVRSLAALLIAWSLIRATHSVEEERDLRLAIVQQARLEALQQREALRRRLLQHTVEAQEDERARIARELHDETAQTLSAFSLELAALDAGLKDQPSAHARVERLKDLSRQVTQGLYRLVGDLRPAHLDDFGLVPAVNYLLTQARASGIQFELHTEGHARRIDLALETVLFRVAQESITNITRHSGARHAVLLLCFDGPQVRLTITDDGHGFDSAVPYQGPRGWGLEGMRERVEAAGGVLTLTTSPGRGTVIEAVIPLEAAHAAPVPQ